MNSSPAISKIFWPSHLCSRHIRTGFIVGWNVRSFTACISTIVSDIDLASLVSALGMLTADIEFTAANRHCGVQPVVLGVVIVPYATGQKAEDVAESNRRLLESAAVQEHKDTANLWLTIDVKETYIPALRDLDCCGFGYNNVSSEIIYYKQPDPRSLQFLSQEPLILDISKINASGALFDANTSPKIMSKRPKYGAGHQHLFMPSSGKSIPEDMHSTMQQINTSYELEQAIHFRAKKYLRRRVRSRSMSEAVKESAVGLGVAVQARFTLVVRTVWPAIQPIAMKPLIILLLILRAAVELCLWILNMRFPSWAFNGIALKDLSTTGQQIDLRLQQACFWPWQYIMVRKRAWTNTSVTRAQYISFYNSMWLVANDIIIGVALGSFLISNNRYMTEVLTRYVQGYTITSLSDVLEWLTKKNEYPAGLKLNPELNPFLGQLFKWLLELWTDFIYSFQPIVPMIINMIGLSGAFGATMALSLISDLLSFTTLHIYWFYMVAARIFHWQLTILYSLFNLFRGKKRNTLRHRIDSCDYDLDQLLLGTILFTLLTFLFPTIVVYYLTFAFSRVAVICMQAFMETVLASLNHFPLFAIMLRLKDPDRLPGGLRIEVCPERFFFDRATPLRWVVSSLRAVSVDPKSGGGMSSAGSLSGGSAKGSMASGSQSGRSNHAMSTGSRLQQEQQLQNLRQRSSIFGVGWKQDATSHDSVENSEYLPASPLTIPRSNLSYDQSSCPTGSGALQANGTSINNYSVAASPRSVSYLFMTNLPLPISAIFFQYSVLWKRLSSHYFSLHVLQCLVSGETIRPIPRLQYPMLPEIRMKFQIQAIKPTLYRFWVFCGEVLQGSGSGTL